MSLILLNIQTILPSNVLKVLEHYALPLKHLFNPSRFCSHQSLTSSLRPTSALSFSPSQYRGITHCLSKIGQPEILTIKEPLRIHKSSISRFYLSCSKCSASLSGSQPFAARVPGPHFWYFGSPATFGCTN
jgi:hypothetical protein